MDPARWQQISRIYHAALERDVEGRAAFLDEACVGNDALRHEIESLLACETDATRLLDAPAEAARALAANRGELHAGQRLAHYRIVDRLGAGGMGVVYRARDERLRRDIAVKVLPAGSFGDELARARLFREARAAAALNHPYICTIHEVGEADGQAYIAMELVDGQPLSACLAARALRPEQVMRYGVQLADALDHAHDRGIVHRDLKSANVMVTPEGRIKVLDFGLAKLMSGDGLTEGVTSSQAKLTRPWTLVGTLAYMAPEQLRGQAADVRSDVWALGVVLYEMAAGTRPFERKTGFEVSSAILSEHPLPLPASVPHQLSELIGRCLQKEPAQRFQRTGEVRAVLEAMQTTAAVHDRLEVFFSQSLDGFFFMMLDEPVCWDASVDKDAVLDYVFAHQHVTKINDAMLAQYGVSREKFLGTTPADFFRHDLEYGRRVWREFFDRGRLHVETDERRVDGTPIRIDGDYICFYDDQGRITGHFGIQRDVTEQIRMRQLIEQHAEELERRNVYLQEELKTEGRFGEIVGSAESMQRVFRDIEMVAATDSTVLVLGESGTGKELIARAIHLRSRRRDAVMVKVNCGAIPAGLAESELFGHEKGAVTGAVQRKPGRFVLADHGTIFLDEIGELSLDLQVKVLRVLQDREAEPVGATRALQINVRMIAATNRDLDEAVRRGTFRQDLFYRLNVFPIHVPPLRERQADVPLLASHFVLEFAKRMGKPVRQISVDAMRQLASYPWPGNVRELANVLERAVILCDGPTILEQHLGMLTR